MSGLDALLARAEGGQKLAETQQRFGKLKDLMKAFTDESGAKRADQAAEGARQLGAGVLGDKKAADDAKAGRQAEHEEVDRQNRELEVLDNQRLDRINEYWPLVHMDPTIAKIMPRELQQFQHSSQVNQKALRDWIVNNREVLDQVLAQKGWQ
jgi:hypothetical protein